MPVPILSDTWSPSISVKMAARRLNTDLNLRRMRGEIDGNQHTMPDFGEALVRFGENPVLPGFTDRKDRTIGLRDDPLGGRSDEHMLQTASAVRSHDDQVRRQLLGESQNGRMGFPSRDLPLNLYRGFLFRGQSLETLVREDLVHEHLK